MPPIPSLPFLPSASLPEVLWVTASLIGLWVAASAWFSGRNPRAYLKNGIRAVVSLVFLADGVAAMLTPPVANPTWLSVITPMTCAFAAFSMALLSVIDEQTNPVEPKVGITFGTIKLGNPVLTDAELD